WSASGAERPQQQRFSAAQQRFQRVSVTAACGESSPVIEDNGVFPVEETLYFLDLIKGDDGGSADAEKLVWIQLVFQLAEGFAHEVGSGPGVDFHIVVGGTDPVDFAGFDENDAAVRFDREPVEVPFF